MDLNTLSEEVNKYIPVWKIRQVAESATNYVMNYTEPEAKVREATNEDAWGPTGPLLAELVRYTNMYTCFGEVMGMLWTRIGWVFGIWVIIGQISDAPYHPEI